jgi:hypothetical protein
VNKGLSRLPMSGSKRTYIQPLSDAGHLVTEKPLYRVFPYQLLHVYINSQACHYSKDKQIDEAKLQIPILSTFSTPM